MSMVAAKKHFQKAATERLKAIAALPYRRKLARLRCLDPDRFWQYQAERLHHIYGDAVLHVPYYRDQPHLYPRALPPGENLFDIIRQLPILRKEIVKKETEKFWREPALFGTAQHTTGGTTGSPLRIRASLSERGFTQAILEDRYEQIVGTDSPRILRLSGYLDRNDDGAGIFQKIPGTKFAYLSIYALSAARRDEVLEILSSFRPQVIHGYASAIHQLALTFENRAFPASVEPFIAVTTSETLMPNQREDIERLLNTRVFDEYGSQEGQHLIVECRYGTMHIHPAGGVVELLGLESDKPTKVGDIGRVVVTGIRSRTMPLLRYELGDTAVSTEYATECHCGLRWPSVGAVYGRIEDLVITRDGRRIPLLSHSTMKDIIGIKEAQIIQKDYDRFVYYIVRLPGYRAEIAEPQILSELKHRVDISANIEFRYVNALERTPAGKSRAVVVAFEK